MIKRPKIKKLRPVEQDTVKLLIEAEKVPKPVRRQNDELLHFFDREYCTLTKVMGEAFMNLALFIDKLPESFSKAVALRHLMESRDWVARAQYIRPVEKWVEGETNTELTNEWYVARK